MSIFLKLLTTLKRQVRQDFILNFFYIFILFFKTGIASPAIVGVDWRLDYSIRSKYAGRENAPIFFVSLKVKDRGLLRYINMTASIQELQDLLSKVFFLLY